MGPNAGVHRRKEKRQRTWWRRAGHVKRVAET